MWVGGWLAGWLVMAAGSGGGLDLCCCCPGVIVQPPGVAVPACLLCTAEAACMHLHLHVHMLAHPMAECGG